MIPRRREFSRRRGRFAPGIRSDRAQRPMGPRCSEMAFDVESVEEGGVRRQKPLCLSRAPEALHLEFASSRRLIRILHAIILPLVRLVGPLTLAPTGASPSVSEVAPAKAASLCGRSLNWIEIVR